MLLDPSLIGQLFTVPNTPGSGPLPEYRMVGFAQNDTFLIMGALNDTVNNRFEIISFKMKDVKFKGQVTRTNDGLKII
jgi:hypothetical protein